MRPQGANAQRTQRQDRRTGWSYRRNGTILPLTRTDQLNVRPPASSPPPPPTAPVRMFAAFRRMRPDGSLGTSLLSHHRIAFSTRVYYVSHAAGSRTKGALVGPRYGRRGGGGAGMSITIRGRAYLRDDVRISIN